MLSPGIILFVSVGLALGWFCAFLRYSSVQRRSVRADMRDDGEVLAALQARLRPIADAVEASPDRVTAAVMTALRTILETGAGMLPEIEQLLAAHTGLAAEYERGLRGSLGVAKGVLDCLEAVIVPQSGFQKGSLAALAVETAVWRDWLVRHVARSAKDGIDLDDEAGMLEALNLELADIGRQAQREPLAAALRLSGVLHSLNSILTAVDIKTVRLPPSN